MSENSTEQHAPEQPRKRPTYKRQRLKKQFTVRIDENLAEIVIARAESEGLRLTDAMEEGLWLWMRKKRAAETVLRGRFLWNVIPLRLQKLTLSFWVYLTKAQLSSTEEIYRKGFEDALWTFREHPQYLAGLEELGKLPESEEEEG